MNNQNINLVNINNNHQIDRKEEIPIYQQNQSNQQNTIYSNYADLNPYITDDLEKDGLSYYYDTQTGFLSKMPDSYYRIFK